ncbi:MAG: pyridoxal-phosphate dependent enzyme, partial [Actinobacteria bacterium]|nr:pyridoxal-phosphate dependent enzyme [Actinomycetota bacterium]
MENLYYKSTRSEKERILSSKAIVNGIAGDGGLYVPESLPAIDLTFSKLLKMSFKELAYFIIRKFLTDFTEDELRFCIEKAYDEKFDTPEIAPLVKKDNVFFLELYHGATAAFKDMALSLLPYLLTAAVKKTGIEKEIVILTATSGDTGKAALESFSNVEGTKIIVFYPNKGVSLIQQRQMVTQAGKNTFVVAIEGNFDDAQTGVKNIFNDKAFNELLNKNNYMFSSANSINIGRLIPQIVYYISAYLRMIEMGEVREEQKINITVPTGNFGNILASYYSRGVGLP